MKRIILILCLILFGGSALFAQQQRRLQLIPNDSTVRIGVLPNGMKYYIAKNCKPKGVADFYIIHNVGAIQEEDHQNGLAHFLEHMAFNGTKNLPNKKMITYFQSNGVEFGRDINAMTGLDETHYMIKNVPTAREGILDTAIIAIADWSGGITLDGKEIDSERGVIIEEKRTTTNVDSRMQEKYMPLFYNGSKYAKRNIIGTDAILKNFKHSEIREFYAKWYRPDLQAVIAVGDFDVDQIEAKIKKVMGAIPAPENAVEKEIYTIADYPENFVKIVSDKEFHGNSVMITSLSVKEDKRLNATVDMTFKNLIATILNGIINDRYEEIAQQVTAKFLGASVSVGSFTANNDIFTIQVTTADAELPDGVEAVMREFARFRKFGVTDDELERSKNQLLKSIQATYDNRANRSSSSFAKQMIANYINNSPIFSQEMSYQFYKNAISQLTTEVVNEYIPYVYPDKPSAIVAMVSDQTSVGMDEKELLNASINGQNAEVEPVKNVQINRPLMEKEPLPVPIKKETRDPLGNTVWHLSNGAKVVVKNTNFSADQILFSGLGVGGKNRIPDQKLLSAAFLPNMWKISGLGSFNERELSNVLSDKKVKIGKSITGYSHSISGNSTINDLETMFQLLHLSFTAQPMRQAEFDYIMKYSIASLAGVESKPDYQFQEKCQRALYGDDLRVRQLNGSNVKEITLEDVKSIDDMLFDGVGDMIFVFTGSIDQPKLKQLVEKYIASLPKGGIKNENPTATKLVKGKVNEEFKIAQETPKVTYTAMFYSDDMKDMSIKKTVTASILQSILQEKYNNSIREKMGATYAVSVQITAVRNPTVRYSINVGFDTNEEKMREAIAEVREELERIANGKSEITNEFKASVGVKIKNFNKAIESNNGAWINHLLVLHKYGNNNPKDYVRDVESITEKDVRNIAATILKSGNEIHLVMVP